MPWARFDERFPGHRHIRRLSDSAFRLHVSAVCWSCEYLTDGNISSSDIEDVSNVKRPAQAAAELVRSGRWHLPGHDCPSDYCFPISDGWLIHEFLEYNPSKQDVETKRATDAERKRRGRIAESRKRPRGRTADSKRNPSGLHDESEGSPPVPSRPDPNRTEPKDVSGGAAQVVDAYVRGARSINAPDPSGSLCARVGKQAKAMLLSHPFELLETAAFNMGTKGWHDLAVEIQQMAANSNGAQNKATQRTQQGLAIVRRLEAEQRGEIA